MIGAWWARWLRCFSGLKSEWSGEGVSVDVPRWISFWIHVLREFVRNRCQVRAAGLAYTTLLALIPLLAVSLAVASLIFDVKKPENHAKLSKGLEDMVNYVAPALGLEDSDGKAQRVKVAGDILTFVGNIDFGAIGVTAAAGLIFVAISLLRSIESAFNDIWGVSEGRGWFQSVVLYWAAISLGPILFIIVKSLGYVQVLGSASEWFQRGLGHWLLLLSSFIPLILLTIMFASLYRLVPNTRVHWSAAWGGGAVAAGLWWLNNQGATLYNSNVVANSKIYGSLGILPLFLAGLYLSWLILLLGAQTAYVFQHRQGYLEDCKADQVDQTARELAAIRIMLEIGRRFVNGLGGPTLDQVAVSVGISLRLAQRLIRLLQLQGLVCEVVPPPRSKAGQWRSGAGDTQYAPAQALANISLAEVWQAVRGQSGGNLPALDDSLAQAARVEMEAMIAPAEARGRTVRLSDIVQRLS